MKKVVNTIRNFFTATKGTPVSEPKMVTKELPIVQSVTETSEQKEETRTWTDTVSIFVNAFIYGFALFFRYVGNLIHYVGKFIGSVFMWSIILYVVGYFVPELRYEVLSPVYNWVDLYLSLLRKLAVLVIK